ncbi:SusC/RagA family TonB-linked outer membrane protein [Tenacibaculum finnmarkense]|uniref:SusC/RagA family TonB-linked outer membrane protein n=1 Tax=Tenacibaculum finnmarkense TaxID=2781243 RepID=UPI001E498E4D|nr:SusC/RagA family TonB-linked outer membrane protein [Tenacibaculum finnmarkense]MCD8409249.1 SusC/RagA family TonB-linked outer membrane protein [Tenacibaculum finnmarkense genomovar ulcerans]
MRVTLLWLLFLVSQFTFAQEKTISGVVSDESGGLPGVSIIIKGTTTGVETDFDGNYSINAKQNDILVFSFVGKATQVKTVGASNKINVVLADDANLLNEVVVTALGIKREKKSLGYAVSQVKGDDLNKAKSPSVTSSLSGRVAGVNITSSSNMGGSTNVVIRGGSSLTGSNQALYVIDGVPVSNASVGSGDTQRGAGGYDYGNLASDINPEDIESVSILKGASAAVLYGSRGANGVILITTKKGKKSKGLGVTISSSLTVDQINEDTLPNYQNQYGGGGNWTNSIGDFNTVTINGKDYLTPQYNEDISWGPKFDPSIQVLHWDAFDPTDTKNYLKTRPWVAPKNGPEAFFKAGFLKVNNISLEGGSDNGNFRVSYTNTDQEGTIPNSELQKNTIAFNGALNLSDKLSTSVNVQYINTTAQNRPGTGYDSSESLSFMASAGMWMQTNVDYDRLKNYTNGDGSMKTWNRSSATDGTAKFWNNPYWTVNKNVPEDSRDRFIGNWTVNYELNDWLSAMGRMSIDHYDFTIEEKIANGSFGTSRYNKSIRTGTERNYDGMLNFNKDVSDKFNITGLVGVGRRINTTKGLSVGTVGGLVIDDLYTIANSRSAEIKKSDWESKKMLNSVYSTVSFGYDNMLFLDLSARNDWSSTLAEGNNSYFYPSVSTSFIFSKVLKADFLSFGKIRANWASVGNDAPFSVLNDTYYNYGNFGDKTFRYGIRGTKNNPDLQAEKLNSYELGLDLKMFKNRVGVGFSYYNKKSTNLIIPGTVSYGTGYSKEYGNSGEKEDKGFEVELNATVVKTDNFAWNTGINWSTNKSKVIALTPGIDSHILNSNGVAVVAKVGQPYGLLVGTDYIYDDKGNKVVENGLYKKSQSDQVLGDVNPEWRAGFTNSFTYKRFTLNTLIDAKIGGDLYSLTHYWGTGTGILEGTTGVNSDNIDIRKPIAEGGGLILPGVNTDGTKNDTRVSAFDAYYYDNNPHKGSVFDASYVKLREVSLSYSFPTETLEKINLTSLSLSVIGRNLAILHRNIDHIDPEATYGTGNVQGLDIGTLPTTRSFGFSVKLGF